MNELSNYNKIFTAISIIFLALTNILHQIQINDLNKRILNLEKKELKMTKYKITPRDLDEKGGIERLEAIGHNRHTIHEALFKITDGISNQDRTKLMKNLYTRSLESRYGKPTRWI